jgi:uncharacterized protein
METQTIRETKTNLEIVQQGYADFANGNIDGIVQNCADGVTWGSYDNPVVPVAGTFTGKEGVYKFFKILGETVQYTEFTPHEFICDDTKNVVLVTGFQSGVVKLTGKTFAHSWVMEFRFHEGKIKSFFAYVDSNDQARAFTQNLN